MVLFDFPHPDCACLLYPALDALVVQDARVIGVPLPGILGSFLERCQERARACSTVRICQVAGNPRVGKPPATVCSHPVAGQGMEQLTLWIPGAPIGRHAPDFDVAGGDWGENDPMGACHLSEGLGTRVLNVRSMLPQKSIEVGSWPRQIDLGSQHLRSIGEVCDAAFIDLVLPQEAPDTQAPVRPQVEGNLQ